MLRGVAQRSFSGTKSMPRRSTLKASPDDPDGWVQVLFAGNALATHDLEQALYGTSLGVSIGQGEAIEHGHEHHLRAINAIRRLGGIARRSSRVW